MKILKLLAATLAVGLVACGGPDTPAPEVEHKFEVTASKQQILPNGADVVEFVATFDGERVTEGVKAFDVESNQEVNMPSLAFSTEEEGDYKFYFTYTFEQKEYSSEYINIAAKNLTANVNTTVFQMGVDDVYFLIYYKGELITYPDADLTIMDYETHAEIVPEGIEVEVDGRTVTLPKYVADKVGTRKLYIYYKTSHTRKKPIELTAVDYAVPKRLADAQPESTNFTKRAFLTQFTGTGCGFCPYISAALYAMKSDAQMVDKFVNVAVHTYHTSSELYPSEAGNIDAVFGVSGYPVLMGDMRWRTSNLGGWELNQTRLTNYVNSSVSEGAKAGISISVGGSESNTVVVRATVKAAANGNYRVGAWLVEDNIYGVQTNNMNSKLPEGMTKDTFNYHNGVLRIADSEPASSYTGHNLGYMNVGDVVDKVFIMELKEDAAEASKDNKVMNHKKHWVRENCRLVVFVTTESKDGYYVANVISNTSLTESVAFDYQ